MHNVGKYSFSWLNSLDHSTKREIFFLTNAIIQETNTIGFHKPLLNQEAMQMLSSLGRDLRERKKHLLLIRNNDMSLIGHAILSQNTLPNCLHRAEISRAMVHPQHRSYSLLHCGLQQILKKSKELGIFSLELDVRAYTSLSRLWKFLGFEIIGENPDYARINGKVLKGFYMRQSIENLKKLIDEKDLQ